MKDAACNVGENKSTVIGSYELTVTTGNETSQLCGIWQVSFENDQLLGYWYIEAVQINRINF